MNILKSAAVLGLALAAAPVAASAQTTPAVATALTQAPITITSCDVSPYEPVPGRRFYYPSAGVGNVNRYTDGLHIAYVNTTPKVVSRVAFTVNYRGDVQHVVDAGTFAPGTTIDHAFGQYTGIAYRGSEPNRCRVSAVQFTDGTMWQAFPESHI